MLGEANRSRTTRPITSIADYRQWFTELADGLGLTEMSLVGDSMGGFTAAFLAVHMPERVRRLVLISPAATFHSIWPFYRHMFLPKAAHLLLPWLPGVAASMRRSVEWVHAGLPGDGPWKELWPWPSEGSWGSGTAIPPSSARNLHGRRRNRGRTDEGYQGLMALRTGPAARTSAGPRG